MVFKVIYAYKVYEDLQQAVDFYNSRDKGLGVRFFKSVKIQISQIKSNAYGFQVRTYKIISIHNSLQGSCCDKYN